MDQQVNRNETCHHEIALATQKNVLNENSTILDLFLSAEAENSFEQRRNQPVFESKTKMNKDIASYEENAFLHSAEEMPVSVQSSSSSGSQPFSHHSAGTHPFDSSARHYVFVNNLPVELYDEVDSPYHSSSTCISSLWVFPQKWILRPSRLHWNNVLQQLEGSTMYHDVPPFLLLDEGSYGSVSQCMDVLDLKGNRKLGSHLSSASWYPSNRFRYRYLLERVIPKRKKRKNSKLYPLSLVDYSRSVLSDYYKNVTTRLRHTQACKENLGVNALLSCEKTDSRKVANEVAMKATHLQHIMKSSENESSEEQREANLREEGSQRTINELLQTLQKQRREIYIQRGKLLKRRLLHRAFHGCSSPSPIFFRSGAFSRNRSLHSPSPLSPTAGNATPQVEEHLSDIYYPSNNSSEDHESVLLLPLPNETHPCYDGVQLEPGHRYQVMKFVGEHLCPAGKNGFSLVFPNLHIVHPLSTTSDTSTPLSTALSSVPLPTEDALTGNRRSSSVSPSPLASSSMFSSSMAKPTPPPLNWSSTKAGRTLAMALFQRENPGKVMEQDEDPRESVNDDVISRPLCEAKVNSWESDPDTVGILPHCTSSSHSDVTADSLSPSHTSDAECDTTAKEKVHEISFSPCPSSQRNHLPSPDSKKKHSTTAPKENLTHIYAQRSWDALFGSLSQ